jgi:predicted CopG family antitoxin
MGQTEITTIKVSRETHAALSALKQDDETFDDVVARLCADGDADDTHRA